MSGFWPPEIPSTGIYITVLRAFLNSSLWVHPTSHVLRHLVEQPLNSSEVSCMPQGIAGSLPLLRKNHDQMHCAIAVAQEFDLFEAASAVVDLAISVDDHSFLLAAASMCGNPAVDDEARSLLSERVGEEPVGDRMRRIRFDPNVEPTSERERYLYAQCWPGVRTDHKFSTAPVVVFDCLLDPSPGLRLAVRVHESCCCVQRLAPDSDVPLWFGSETVLVCLPETSQRVRDAYPDFPAEQIITDDLPDDNSGLVEVLHEIDAKLPDKSKLRVRETY